MRVLWIGLMVVGLSAGAQAPVGTQSVDDHARSDAAAQQMREAESALEKQDYKGAEEKLKVVLAAKPEIARVLYDLGFAEERNGEEAEAAKSYAASSAVMAGFAEPRVALGLMDARAGRLAEAHKELLEAAKIPTAAPELRARALRALAKMDERTAPEDAREELLGALKLTAETPGDVLMGAQLAEESGDAADAELAYKRALGMLPGDVEATVGLVHVLQRQKKLDEADVVVTAALKGLNGKDLRLVVQAASLYATEGKVGLAIPLLEEVRASDAGIAENPPTTRLLARLYAMNGDYAKAEVLYVSVVPAFPKDAGLLDDLGTAQVKQKQYADAEATLMKAVAMRAEFHDDAAWGEAASHLAFAASKNGDPKVSLEALTARNTVLPNTASSLFLEAIAHDSLHQKSEAVRTYKAFLAMAAGTMPDEEFEARHRLVALAH